eukprot:Rmarinus@m.20051
MVISSDLQSIATTVLHSPEVWKACTGIVAAPLIWNTLARLEYRQKVLSRLFGGAYPGCYALAAWIFGFSLYRDHLVQNAIEATPTHEILDHDIVKGLALSLSGVGGSLVISSMYRLGVTGTYLGDYFGILMKERVTSFPFSVCADPMYTGSTLCFAGLALYKASPAGLFLTGLVHVTYRVALKYESPFTDDIYRNSCQPHQD